jgi:hypothetical protein
MKQRDLEIIVDALAPAIVNVVRKATQPLIEHAEALEKTVQQSD